MDEWGMDGQILNDGGALKQLVTMHHYADDVKQAVKMSVEAGITRILDQVSEEMAQAVDRRSLELESEDLIKMVWKANPNTIVALISSFPYTIDWTQEHVPSILHVSQCSQELGNALADVI